MNQLDNEIHENWYSTNTDETTACIKHLAKVHLLNRVT